MPVLDILGCLPACKDVVDLLANAERAIERLSEYGDAIPDGHVVQASAGAWDMTGTATTGPSDPVASLSFSLSLLAAAYVRRAGR